MATLYVNNNTAAQTTPAIDTGQALGTIANPYTTIAAADAAMAEGDTVLLRGGLENGNEPYRPAHVGNNVIITCHDVATAGTAGNWTTFQAYDPANEPVVYNGVDSSGLRHNGCIEIDGKPYVAYRNIEVTDADQRIVRVRNGSNFVTLSGITAHKNYTGNIAAIHIGGLVQNAVVEGCEAYDAGRGILLSGSIINGQQNDPDNQVRYCVIRNCYAHDNIRDQDDSDGMQAAGAPDNTWIDCVSLDNADDGFDLFGGSHRNTCRRCISIGHAGLGEGEGRGFVAGVWGQAPQGDGIGGAVDCSLEWCVARDNKFNFFSSGVRLSVTNCTGVNAGLHNMRIDESAGNEAQTTIKHCLWYGSGQSDILSSVGKANPIAYCDWNAYSDTSTANDHPDESGHDANSVFSIADPFVDWTDSTVNTAAVLDGAAPDITGLHLTAGHALLTGGEGGAQIGAFGAPVQDETMASYQYNHVNKLFFEGTVTSGSTIKGMLMAATYVPDPDITAIDTTTNTSTDPSSHEIQATNYQGGHAGTGRKTITLSFSEDNANDRSVAVLSNQTWASLGGVQDADVSGVLVFAEGTSDTDSKPLYFVDGPTITTNGSNVNVTFNQTATIIVGPST